MPPSLRKGWLFVLLAALYCIAQAATLTRTPLPWADEVFFASMTDSLSRQGTLHVLAEPITYPQPLLLYGPVYFALSVPLERLFGLTPLTSRLPGMIFGLAIVAVVFATLRRRGVLAGTAFLICSLIALDPRFSASFHTGRMDTTALFFLLASFLLLLKAREAEGNAGLWYAAGAGLLAVLGVLTTPRPGYLILAMGVVLTLRLFRDRPGPALARLAVWSGVIVAIYLIWVFAAFGSIGGLIAYFQRFAKAYVGGLTFVPSQLPLLVLVLAPLLILLWLRPRAFGDELLLFSILGTAGYFVFVKDFPLFGGTYSVLMLPFTYLTLGLVISMLGGAEASAPRRTLGTAVLGLLLVANGAGFFGRTLLVVAQWGQRNPRIAERLVAAVPAGSRVVGDEAFYFAVRGAGSEFQFFQWGVDLRTPIDIDRRASYHRDVYRAQYLVTAADAESKAVQTYVREFGLVKVAGPPPPPEQGPLASLLVKVARKFGYGADANYRGYQGVVYGRPDAAAARHGMD
jgi:4-amino-4-deoxy-L-arabinose transferase-like glycosyltransferase